MDEDEQIEKYQGPRASGFRQDDFYVFSMISQLKIVTPGRGHF